MYAGSRCKIFQKQLNRDNDSITYKSNKFPVYGL